MLIPFAFMRLFGMVFFIGFGHGGPPLGFLLRAFIMLVLGAPYTVGLSAVGGYLGVYVKNEL